ncbi:MAG: alpha/beta hydrolase, partial [Pseudomonadota bacterium]|nr:alpha/beta hydrolase [Pseudomonadota bacterium]
AIRLASAGNRDATTLQLAGLNHLFQSARSGAIAEYAEIGETFSPAALEAVSGWIAARFGTTL